MRNKLKNLLFKILLLLFPKLYNFSHKYIDWYNSDNNSNFLTNGEVKFVNSIILKSNQELCIFDVGANKGDWSEYFKNINPNLNMHLFEPSKKNFSELAEKNWSKNVTLNNFALGHKREKKIFNIYEKSTASSFYQREGIKNLKILSKEEVQVEMLDKYCEEKNINIINYLKIDTEGHDLHVLKGA